MNTKNIITTLIAAGIFLAATPMAYASGSSECQIIYGGGQVCKEKVSFTIDKKVMSPTKGGEFVDNLNTNDAKFTPASEAVFKITIQNTGDKTIDKLDVVDTLPANTVYVTGNGSYDKSKNAISYTITGLAKGATDERSFSIKIGEASTLPQTQGILCLTNNSKATDNNGSVATDASSFCVEKNFVTPEIFNKVPVKSTPSTGPELLPLLGLIPAGIAGFALRRKSKFN